MLVLNYPKPVKLLCGIIFKEESILEQTIITLKRHIGKIDYISHIIDFNYTDYYEDEMGKDLKRVFISFEKLIKLENIYKIKLLCIKIEKKFAISNKRTVNIDPGYINEAKLVLLTTKDFYHRIYLKKGVFCEVTLYYSNKELHNLPWTYPDYQTKEYKDILLKIRDIYKSQLP